MGTSNTPERKKLTGPVTEAIEPCFRLPPDFLFAATSLYLFFPARSTIATIITITNTTRNIPTPIPALNIPSMALHEDTVMQKNIAANNKPGAFFILLN
jgi:hypothetical protein